MNTRDKLNAQIKSFFEQQSNLAQDSFFEEQKLVDQQNWSAVEERNQMDNEIFYE